MKGLHAVERTGTLPFSVSLRLASRTKPFSTSTTEKAADGPADGAWNGHGAAAAGAALEVSTVFIRSPVCLWMPPAGKRRRREQPVIGYRTILLSGLTVQGENCCERGGFAKEPATASA